MRRGEKGSGALVSQRLVQYRRDGAQGARELQRYLPRDKPHRSTTTSKDHDGSSGSARRVLIGPEVVTKTKANESVASKSRLVNGRVPTPSGTTERSNSGTPKDAGIRRGCFAPSKKMEIGTPYGLSARYCRAISGGATKSSGQGVSARHQLCTIELDNTMKPDDTRLR
jgi:hypothetical protein